ncbi:MULTISPECIES: hypothetical protein [Xanthomonas translucens group]|uniref:hypothetical protein n=1 Tax=Xanthomonas translucens group TaxID=3390202 RepID=UPI00071E7670|nr:hypothetical protein [Xanthomonas translucens]KWV17076.1 hypothetical protein ATB54_00120 [Xanthomonas translucens]MCS3360674.1 hypothetical protein [Xanthomonas translucens pv. translucens]MCS3373294.1 hypothetical protein [Xanthomonas translucens pv. translucens]MCT8290251.1 hypothetical protein [Xanthomonas translucens pv. translucens]MCT8293933.1 hypothetical protein [Xanthomonas translucens pv. translucens]
MPNFINTLNRVFGSAKTAGYAGLTALVVVPGFAMAADGADFDGSTIVAKVVAYTAIGVTILAAFALGRWTLRALGLIGGK